MNFYKGAAAIVLMMALASCNRPESTSSEPAAPEVQTISMETACTELKQSNMMKFIAILEDSTKTETPPDAASLDELGSIVVEIDGIAKKIDSPEGAAKVQEIADSMAQLKESLSKEALSKEDFAEIIQTNESRFVPAINAMAPLCPNT